MQPSRFLRLLSSGILALVMADAARAQPASEARSRELDELIAEYEMAMETFQSSPKDQRGPSPWKVFPSRFLSFAKKDDDDASLRACEYIILKFYISNERHDAIDLVTLEHFDKADIGSFLGNLVHSYDCDEAVDQCLLKAIDSGNPRTRVLAQYQQARMMINRRNWCLDGDAQRYDGFFDEPSIASFQAETTRQQIAALLGEVVAESPTTPYFGRPLVEWAEQDLFEIEHLEAGQPVPDISGRDSEGQIFRVSDYRGKVVVITFWAHWCAACIADLPEETEFVTKMSGRPMVWLGVNGDEDLALLQKAEQENKVNFRSWHDGENGPIADRFAVRGWPTMYVIDQEGIIRYRSRISVELEQAKPVIESLVKEAERASTDGRTN